MFLNHPGHAGWLTCSYGVEQIAEICWTRAKTGAGFSNLRQEVAAQASRFPAASPQLFPFSGALNAPTLDRKGGS